MQVLLVIDMQNDFISGALANADAAAILPAVQQRIESFDGPVFFTRDTHSSQYLSTLEGKMLPVPHCIQGTPGWQIHPLLRPFVKNRPINKPAFGSVGLISRLTRLNRQQPIAGITLIGVCTDICVISNALLLKAHFPQIPISVDAACCAGVTPQRHQTALQAMSACQIVIENQS